MMVKLKILTQRRNAATLTVDFRGVVASWRAIFDHNSFSLRLCFIRLVET